MMDALVIFLAAYLIFLIGLLALYTLYKTKNKVEFALAIVLAGFWAIFLAGIAGLVYNNPRPFVSQSIDSLIPHGPDNGFPSMHTVMAMALTATIYFYRRKFAAIALVATLLVGAGRVWAHVHWWIDIAGGLVVGAIAGYTGAKLAKLFFSAPSARQPKGRR